jgi:hypothetical protein
MEMTGGIWAMKESTAPPTNTMNIKAEMGFMRISCGFWFCGEGDDADEDDRLCWGRCQAVCVRLPPRKDDKSRAQMMKAMIATGISKGPKE